MENTDVEVLEKPKNKHQKIGPFEKRVHEVDFARGVLIFLVVFDHVMNHIAFDGGNLLSPLAGGALWYWYGIPRAVIRLFALIGFSFISGISCAFSRNNWLRAAQMLLIWAVLSVGSTLLEAWQIIPGVTLYIPFNVIGVLAFSTFFYCFVQKKSWKGILAMLLFSFLMCQYFIPWFENINILRGVEPHVPAFWEPTYYPGPGGLAYADWLPLFPFMTAFMLGALISYFVYQPTKQSIIKRKGNWERPVCFIGRHTLLIYIGHQILLVPIFMALASI